jgi:ATP-dependent helicase HrpA
MEKPEHSVRALLGRLRRLTAQAMLRDQTHARRVLNRLQKAGRQGSPKDAIRDLEALEKRLDASVKQKQDRARRVPSVSFPKELPISRRADEIIRTIRDHRVVIVAGETGSGKSTQLPKMCLKAGRGLSGQIACTQPRRIAAITIAHRIAEELHETLGRSVGYKIRFRDRAAPEGYIKLMTDGMLLAETQSDPRLDAYDTLIVDEAHERSLNIDFLLGIIRTLIETRPELKIVITSATLDTAKFSKAFRNAPVIEVSGRQYPVALEYRPAESFAMGKSDEGDYVELAARAVDLIKKKRSRGDILVFMPTEQDILESCERLEGRKYAGTTVLPLYARLPGTQQGKVYHVKGSKIVVATNVAETSLTIPGIRYVVDTGLARIAQYQPGTRINSLPVSPISRSSADQRAGRCGRVQDGVCFRLYSEKSFASRLEFTPPEILRSNLAEVILRMIDLRLGHPAEFPFVDPPKSTNIKDGYDTLVELGAIQRTKGKGYALTEKGRIMARMPLDPKISRMLLEAREEGCMREVAVIAAALSIRDPRERPPEQTEQADSIHAPFRHPDSDFLTLLNIWDRYHGKLEKLTSRRKQRRFCQEHFLSFSRMREWVHVHTQIQAILLELRVPLGRIERLEIGKELYAGIHRSILSGYLSHIAVLKEKNIYTAAKGREPMVFPGSTLFGRSRPWIVATEMVRTSRLFARTAARIEPGWLEALGGELCRYSYSGAHWDKKRGEVRAAERVTLFGLEIVRDRAVSYARIHPDEAHEIFVRSALVEGELNDPPDFLRHNLSLVERITEMEEKLRRRGLLVGEDLLAEFYSRRLPGMTDERSLRRCLKQAAGSEFLKMKETDLLQALPDDSELAGFPDSIQLGEMRLTMNYRFAPGEKEDGATLKVPSSVIRQIPPQALEWGIPGLFQERIAALVKGLPKRYRKLLVPISEKVEIFLRELTPDEVSLFEELSRLARRLFQVDIPASAWAEAEVPPHLKMRIAVLGSKGSELGSGRDLTALQNQRWPAPEPDVTEEWGEARKAWERQGMRDWDVPDLPAAISIGPFVEAYPGFVPGTQGVGLKLFATQCEALDSHRKGIRALLTIRFGKDLEFLRRYLILPEDQHSTALYFGGKEALEQALFEALQRESLEKNLRSRQEFEAYTDGLNPRMVEAGHAFTLALVQILGEYQKTRTVLGEIKKSQSERQPVMELLQELLQTVQALIPKDFLLRYPLDRLQHLPRYLEAVRLRAERGRIDPAKDRNKAEQAARFEQEYRRLVQEMNTEFSPERRAALEEFRWMLEEFKVSLFAPELKTAVPVSSKRLSLKLKAIAEIS